MSNKIKTQLENIPTTPGIYKFFDCKGKILYVGKAVNLKSRVRSYFQDKHLDRPWVAQMIPFISDIQTISTDNEVEALILEANLIKKYSPKYNLSLKDDKRYAWIYIDTQNPYPRVCKTRDVGEKGRYFGPYPDGGSVNRILRYIRRIYPYADCGLQFFPDRKSDEIKRKRVCLAYYLGQCTGPCDNMISVRNHRKQINEIIKMLEGHKKSYIKELVRRMQTLSKEQKFEQAAMLRDKINDLRYISQRIDVKFGDTEEEFREIQKSRFLAGINEVIEKLKLNVPPESVKHFRIECYDISNISGQQAYGSMTVSEGTKIDSSQYRIFKIQKKNKPDDPAMMKEVLERRSKYLQKQDRPVDMNESLLRRPNLILLDGAKTQLSAVQPIIQSASANKIGLLAISKGKHLKRAGQKQVDEFWIMEDDGTFKQIKLQNPFIFERLRDEAHRFAIKHHRNSRKFTQKKSILDEIPGIGPKRRKQLMKKFGTIENIKKADEKEIDEVLKNKQVTRKLIAVLHPLNRS